MTVFSGPEIRTENPVATAGDFAGAGTAVPLVAVAVITGFETRILRIQIIAKDPITAAGVLTVIRTGVLGICVAIVAALQSFSNDMITADG